MKIINKVGKYRKGAWYTRSASDVKVITVHHTAIAQGTYANDDDMLLALQNIHQGHGWPGLSYHFVISEAGRIYQINSFEEVTWHDTKNWDSIGICLQGYFHPNINNNPTGDQLEALDWLLDRLCTETPQIPADHDDVLGHRERTATVCPGDNLFFYVVDYRNKKGSVSWNNPDDDSDNSEDRAIVEELNKLREFKKEAERTIAGLRSSRDGWKEKYHSQLAECKTERAALEAVHELEINSLLKEHSNEVIKLEAKVAQLKKQVGEKGQSEPTNPPTEKKSFWDLIKIIFGGGDTNEPTRSTKTVMG